MWSKTSLLGSLEATPLWGDSAETRASNCRELKCRELLEREAASEGPPNFRKSLRAADGKGDSCPPKWEVAAAPQGSGCHTLVLDKGKGQAHHHLELGLK